MTASPRSASSVSSPRPDPYPQLVCRGGASSATAHRHDQEKEMTTSPLLPPGTAGRVAEAEATAAELDRMAELALSRGARPEVAHAAASMVRSAVLASGPPT
jgi:hypothetical protein